MKTRYLVIMIVQLVLILVFAVYAFIQDGKAIEAEQEAHKQEAIAKENAIIAEAHAQRCRELQKQLETFQKR